MRSERHASGPPRTSRASKAAVAACAIALLAGPLAPAARAAPQLSWSAQTIDSGGALSGISCPSESLCVAVDGKGKILRSTDPTAAPPHWASAQEGGPSFSAVSCASAALCVAVGAQQALVSVDGAATWSSPASIDEKSALTSVSCPSAFLCVAVDEAGQALATASPGAASWPISAIDEGKRLQSVSCSSESSCVTVDNAGRALSTGHPTGGAWPGRRIDASALTAVSCSPAGTCVAVDNEGNALASANAGSAPATWSSTPIAGSALRAVSCASSGLCIAVDAHQAFASDNATAAVPAWSASSADPGAALTGISCLAGGLCVAVDASGQAISGRVPPPDVFTSPPAEAGATEATLAGVINPHDAALTSCVFEYGPTAAYGLSVPCASLPSSGGAQIVTASIGGLAPNSSYHYRLLAASLVGAGAGADQTFTTAVSSSVARVSPHPSIHGTPAVGSRLSCASGVASGAARLSFMWLRDLIPIPRASGSGYTVVGADSGHHLQCEVTASNAGGTLTARSAFVTIPVQGVVAAVGETVVGRARFDRRGVRVPLRCSSQAASGCRIALRLSSAAAVLGSARARLARGQRHTVFVPLNASGRRLRAHGQHPVARLSVTGTVIGVLEAILSQQRVRL